MVNTLDFDSSILGSSPNDPTKISTNSFDKNSLRGDSGFEDLGDHPVNLNTTNPCQVRE